MYAYRTAPSGSAHTLAEGRPNPCSVANVAFWVLAEPVGREQCVICKCGGLGGTVTSQTVNLKSRGHFIMFLYVNGELCG
jgi:hypothetical protein